MKHITRRITTKGRHFLKTGRYVISGQLFGDSEQETTKDRSRMLVRPPSTAAANP